ncbi:hypothetical protein D3C78_1575240 [compost metagenome]
MPVRPPMMSIDLLVELITIQINGKIDRKAAVPRKTYCSAVVARRETFMTGPSRRRTGGRTEAPP